MKARTGVGQKLSERSHDEPAIEIESTDAKIHIISPVKQSSRQNYLTSDEINVHELGASQKTNKAISNGLSFGK